MVKISIKRRFWFGWQIISAKDYQWIAGRTAAAGLAYIESETGGKVSQKLADVSFDLQLAVTLLDDTIEYIPNIAQRRIRIYLEKIDGLPSI